MIIIFGEAYSIWEILAHYWMVLPIAVLVSLIATHICRRVALHYGIVDMPDNKVKTHKSPTAYLGGVGILAGLLAGLAIGIWILAASPGHTYVTPHDSRHQAKSQNQQTDTDLQTIADPCRTDEIVADQSQTQTDLTHAAAQTGGFSEDTNFNWLMLLGIAVGAIVACAVGVIDDIYDLRPWQKLLGQAVAAAILVGVGVRPNFPELFNMFNINLPSFINYILGTLTVLFFILGASNSLNLLDGLDGLCAGVTLIITIAFLMLALILATWGHSIVGDPVRLILCLALVGGTIGFLPFNRHPARIFMGDAGSMLLGFVSGTLMILFMERFGRWSVAAIIIFGLPILDTAVALFRRFVNKKPLFVSDRGHIYDQLMDRGLGLVKTVRISYLLAIIYAVAGLVTALLRFRYAVVVFILIVIVSAWTVYKHKFLQIPEKHPQSEQPPQSEPRA